MQSYAIDMSGTALTRKLVRIAGNVGVGTATLAEVPDYERFRLGGNRCHSAYDYQIVPQQPHVPGWTVLQHHGDSDRVPIAPPRSTATFRHSDVEQLRGAELGDLYMVRGSILVELHDRPVRVRLRLRV
jgi:hypothetical protein